MQECEGVVDKGAKKARNHCISATVCAVMMGSISVNENDGDVSSEVSTIHCNCHTLDRHVINLCTVV